MSADRGLVAAIAIAAFAGGGCFGLGKRDDAVDAKLSASRKARDLRISSLARSAGEVTFVRLAALFPQAVGGASLVEADYTLLGGTGSNRAFGAMERPYSALAQMALRGKAADLCKSQITSAGQDRTNIFTTTGILAPGESLPAGDEAIGLAFAAARNVWLDIFYTAESEEVKELANVYRHTVQNSTSNAALEGRRAVCLVALLAPQFWMGGPSPTDPIRRIALDLGRRLPTPAEMHAFKIGNLTIDQFAQQVQGEAGYLKAIHSWHQEWLGLRPFIFAAETEDPRPDRTAGAGVAHATAGGTVSYGFDTNVAPGGHYIISGGNDIGAVNRVNVAQDFDPRTSFVFWEHQIPDTSQWTLTAAWYFGAAGAAQITAYVTANYPGLSPATFLGTLCVDAQPTGWKRCDGLIPLGAQSSAVTALVNDMNARISNPAAYTYNGKPGDHPDNQYVLNALNSQKTTLDARLGAVAGYYRTKPGDILHPSGSPLNYPNGQLAYYNPGDYFPATGGGYLRPPIANFAKENRRVRRFAPSGEQNGWSVVRTFYTGESVRVNNAFERFQATCIHRPGNSPAAGAALGNWTADSRGVEFFFSTWSPESLWNAPTLADYRCGKPQYSSLVAADGDLSALNAAYPYGWSDAETPSIPSQDGLNDRIVGVHFSGSGAHPETLANIRAFRDLHDEPYHLVNYIVTQNRSYQELLTADYTCGSRELDRIYRMKAYWYPIPLEQADPEFDQNVQGCGTNTDGTPLRKIKISTPIPINLLRASDGGYAEPNISYFTANRQIPPKTLSGILTMPSFLGPVSSGMRTTVARYFLRLLCGEANSFVPTASQFAMAEPFVSKNRGHLKPECVSCHINLDPLAAALSFNFVKYEGTKGTESLGEMIMFNLNGDYAQAVNGIRGGGPLGQGTLLGKPVDGGVREVGEVLAGKSVDGVPTEPGARDFARCVVQKVYENIYGRQIGLEDVGFVSETTDAFMKKESEGGYDYRFNRLVRALVDSPNYKRRN
jgi:hypothetical protein